MKKQTGFTSVCQHRPALARRLGLLLLLTGAFPAANAQILQTPASEEQRRRSQAEALERQRRLLAPHVTLQPAAPVAATVEADNTLTLPTESPCDTLHRFALEVPPRLSRVHQLAGASDLPFDPFRFAQDYLRQYAGVCVGQK